MSAALTVTTMLVTELALTKAVRWSSADEEGTGGSVGPVSQAATKAAIAAPVSLRNIRPVMAGPSGSTSTGASPIEAPFVSRTLFALLALVGANKRTPAKRVPRSAGFAIRSPRGLGDPHDIAPRGSWHLS